MSGFVLPNFKLIIETRFLDFLNLKHSAMKTKTFLFLCLFLGIGLTQLSAQNGKDGTGLYMERFLVSDYNGVPAECGGELIGILSGSITFHFTSFFQNGILIWCKSQGHGEAVSSTGETFKVNVINKINDVQQTGSVHVNFIGDKGTHYIGSFVVADYNTWELEPVRVVCTGQE